MMHQSEFDAANVALSRAADKRKSLNNIHKNRYTATLMDTIETQKHYLHYSHMYILLHFSNSEILSDNCDNFKVTGYYSGGHVLRFL